MTSVLAFVATVSLGLGSLASFMSSWFDLLLRLLDALCLGPG